MSPLPSFMESQDKPPLGTLALAGLISVCSLFTLILGHGAKSGLLLTHGESVFVWQWLSALLIIPGLFALAYAILFLWTIGQVVERLVGWQKFAALTLGTGITLTGLEQVLSLWSEKIPPTSSTIRLVYLLAGLAIMLRPAAEIRLLGEFSPLREDVPSIGLPTWIWVMIFFGTDAIISQQFGSYSGPPFMNVLAVLSGLGLAYVLLQNHPSEEPGEDLPTLLMDAMISRKFRSNAFEAVEEKPARRKKKPKAAPVVIAEDDDDEEEEEPKEKPKVKPSVRMIQAFNTMIEGGNSQGALNQVELIRQLIPDWQIPGDQLRKLIDQTQQMKFWHLCIPLMEEYATRFEGDADTVRLRLAKILVDEQQRPRHALRVLSKIPPDRLGEEMEKTRRKIEQAALEQIEDGVLELESNG